MELLIPIIAIIAFSVIIGTIKGWTSGRGTAGGPIGWIARLIFWIWKKLWAIVIIGILIVLASSLLL